MKNKNKNLLNVTLLLGIFLILPTGAYANVGVPMIVITLPSMFLLLIPIILIEAKVISKTLDINYKKAIPPAIYANVASTIIGVPFAWLISMTIQNITSGGSGGGSDTIWGILMSFTLHGAWLTELDSFIFPLALLFGLLPAYYISVLIEYGFIKGSFTEKSSPLVKKAVINANRLSYSFLVLICIVVFVIYQIK